MGVGWRGCVRDGKSAVLIDHVMETRAVKLAECTHRGCAVVCPVGVAAFVSVVLV